MEHYWYFALALIGSLISLYLLKQKLSKKAVVCPLPIHGKGGSCNDVVNSKYGTMFGVPNEYMGLVYYAGLVVYSILAYFQVPMPSVFNIALLVAASLAALMSLALTFIQIFKLKTFCEWCMTVNVINWAIFLIVVL